MNKVIRDGRVAVLYTSAHGAGWYSWHDIPELLFDPEVVRMIENPDEDEDENTIINYCREKYGTQGYYNGAKSLAIKWIPQGSQFRVQEYDGSETVIVASQEKWIQA